jgi:2,4-dienoyl-CoA reductase (NADPH2)
VRTHLGQRVGASDLAAGKFDEIVLATGVVPRVPRIPGQEHPKVLTYVDVLLRRRPVGRRVAIVGAGGIGFDVASFLVHEPSAPVEELAHWMREWGVADPAMSRGGVVAPRPSPPAREVFLLQRMAKKPGARLGKTTGWIHRTVLKRKKVEMLGGVNYEGIDDRGLAISFGEKRTRPRVLEVDNVVLCAGQEPLRELEAPLRAAGLRVHLIGGADVAAELDAKRAIEQGTRLAAAV